MPDLNATIDEVPVGDSRTIIRNVPGVPTGMTITKAWFTIKENTSQLDNQALVFKEVTNVSSSAGQITNTGGSGTGAVKFIINPVDSGKLTPLDEYEYGIKVLLSDGNAYTFEKGVWISQAAIIRTSS